MTDDYYLRGQMMIDIVAPKHPVEIHISSDGKLWVNVDGKCQLRVNQAPGFALTDERMPKQKEHDHKPDGFTGVILMPETCPACEQPVTVEIRTDRWNVLDVGEVCASVPVAVCKNPDCEISTTDWRAEDIRERVTKHVRRGLGYKTP